ncbi:MAG: hypothetical protein GY935_12165 [Gammaproteobacteria bacterium]|nr:hypothetical protein [Gammaproteobacteria bacterium]
MKSVRLIFALTLLLNFPVAADELQIVLSGKAIHMGDNNLNESNYGLGLQYDFNTHRRWIPLINLASFKDSNNQTSKYIGAGIKRRFKIRSLPQRLNLDLGFAGLIMTRPNYNNEEPFFGAIPFVSVSNDWGGLNATYISEFEDEMLSFWYFQFTLKLMQF